MLPVLNEWKKCEGVFSAFRSATFLFEEIRHIPAYRDAEINLDSLDQSERPEWCTVRYHGTFCPDNAYVVQLRWLVSTGSIINQLVNTCDASSWKSTLRLGGVISRVFAGLWRDGYPCSLQRIIRM